jgi:catechol 2,3-dioxygenase-like lactoylglutathione lyase family enzyme
MEPRLSFVTLGVSNLERSVRFYERVMKFPRLPASPSIAFFELGRTWLALYPREHLAADAGLAPESTGFVGFTLAHNVHSAKEVDRLMGELEAAGTRVVKPARSADWGGYSGYIQDPDGFLWEIAFNPHFPHT